MKQYTFHHTVDDRNPASSYIHTTRFPMLLVYEVYIRSCRIATINSSENHLMVGGFGRVGGLDKAKGTPIWAL